MLYTNKCCFIAVMAFLSSIFISNIASSSVILKGHRIIYSADAKDKVVEFSKNGDTPMLVQVWLDKNNPDSTPDTADDHFIFTP
uniref:fimbrial biogenesis chaperone n=1 Tax=Enterobacter hormaechei TaxID=158836 RepID=UPI0015CCB3BC